jgi:hypothetical protein
MKRLCQKLSLETALLAKELAARIAVYPDNASPQALEAAELVLRDCLANLRRVRNRLTAAAIEAQRQPETVQ